MGDKRWEKRTIGREKRRISSENELQRKSPAYKQWRESDFRIK